VTVAAPPCGNQRRPCHHGSTYRHQHRRRDRDLRLIVNRQDDVDLCRQATLGAWPSAAGSEIEPPAFLRAEFLTAWRPKMFSRRTFFSQVERDSQAGYCQRKSKIKRTDSVKKLFDEVFFTLDFANGSIQINYRRQAA
jgi:hypothetical protein